MISRSTLARHIVNASDADRATVVQQTAAWLVTNNKKREVKYVLLDVARQLEEKGIAWGYVTTARPLSSEAQASIVRYIKNATGCQNVSIDVTIDPDYIGGVRIDTSRGTFDFSVRSQLSDFVQGVTQL